ncbi:MAG: hypothetical protein JNM42_09005 [Propionivibrio sp.]|uniref:hypothetical protein n=1 Tax=Propionivibrio sp. TaxID=2212460 RepID=UPI001A3F5F52|nr:hypothetical protein [Propionivibrio sp.]MBL8414560.1 hypothetical protein [Propionivibrio sp.]
MSTVINPMPSTMTIPDLQTGLQMLSLLTLANPQKAENEINHFLDSLLQSPLQADVYLNLLEQLREPLCFVDEELARHYINKPLPLDENEEGCFRQVIATWLKMAKAYAHYARLDSAAVDAGHLLRIALTLHRSIYYAGLAIVEHQRARRELPPGLWLDLHGYYAAAEKWGVVTLPVLDTLDPLGRNTHCTSAFLSVLLSELAGPYSLSIREQNLVRRWASNWSHLVSLHPAVAGEPLPQFVIDLSQDVGLRLTSDCQQIVHLRRLDTSRLATHMSEIRQKLRQKIPPAQIGLGEDCSSGQCRRLLEHLARPWTQARVKRKFHRRTTSGIAKLCIGFDAMYYYISGKELTPENVRTYSRLEFESLFAFRHMVDPTQELAVRQELLGFTLDQWEVVNQSPNGFRLMRGAAGKKMAHGQLLAICPNEGERFLLAQTTWLMQEQKGGLIAGVAALAGIPQAVAARPLGQGSVHNERYSRAFLLPAVPSVGTDQSLVIPQGWYRAGRILEINADKPWRMKLIHVLDEGPDFERVSFVVVG